MAAALQQAPLYSLDQDAFMAIIKAFAGKALPGQTSGYVEPDASSLVSLKPLPEALANPGGAGSCSKCNLSSLEGCTVDLCLACGAKKVPGHNREVLWSGSLAEKRFLATIPFKPSKSKRRSSRSEPVAVESSPAIGALSATPGASPFSMAMPGDSPAGISPAGAAMGASVAASDSPWSSTLDGASSDPMNVFSLESAVMEFDKAAEAAASSLAARSQGSAALDDFFSQFSDMSTSGPTQGASQPFQGPVKATEAAPPRNPGLQSIMDLLPDMSYMLADHLVIPEKDPGNFPPPVPAPAPQQPRQSLPQSTVEAQAPVVNATPAVNAPPVPPEDEGQDEWGDFES